MGGSISVASKVGEGSCFIIALTFELAPDESITDETSYEEDNLNGYHILLAEDNELNIDIATSLLEDFGSVVDVAENGVIALQKFRDNPQGTFDIILMDCLMPEMDGYEATKAIRALDRPDAGMIPIIAMTANAFADDVKRCLDSGMNDHLAKPFDIRMVVKTIRKYLE